MDGNGFSNMVIQYVSSQMTLTADEVIFHRICATYDIETIFGRFCCQNIFQRLIRCYISTKTLRFYELSTHYARILFDQCW